MKKIFIILTFFLSFFILLDLIRSSNSIKAQGNDHVPGQILVKFKENTSQEEINRQLNGHRASVKEKIEKLGVLVLRVPEVAQDQVLTALSKNTHVEFAEFDYLAETFTIPNDPDFGNQWGLENIGQTIQGVPGIIDVDIDASTAWNITQGGVKVAILDTGIDQYHEDLDSQIVVNKDFTGSTSGYNDIYGHGTHVSGIVAARTNNGMGGAGVCPNCQLMNGKVLNDSASGAYSWIASGITWATDNGAKVINMSLGGSTPSKTLESAVNYAWNNGVVVVAAAGNSGNTSKTYPAAYVNAIAVAATDNQDKKATFSEYGSWVDVAAPGVHIYSTWNDETSTSAPYPVCYSPTQCYKYASGTSMSTPMTTGVVALIWSTGKYTTASEVRSRLELTADKITGTGTYWLAGRINAGNAVGDYIAPTPTPTPTSKPKPGRNK
ncbi:MAG: S8 family peptidase [Candidatus Gottesmanbacteria bacterium]